MLHDLRTLLQTSDVASSTGWGWLLFDTSLTVRDCNPAALRLFQLSREELVDHSLYDLPWLAENDEGVRLTNLERPVALTLRTGKPTRYGNLAATGRSR